MRPRVAPATSRSCHRSSRRGRPSESSAPTRISRSIVSSGSPDRTTTKIYAVPGLARNTHRITAEGEFGSLTIEVRNVPTENPRTGRLSYLSTIALLRDLGATLRVGT